MFFFFFNDQVARSHDHEDQKLKNRSELEEHEMQQNVIESKRMNDSRVTQVSVTVSCILNTPNNW